MATENTDGGAESPTALIPLNALGGKTPEVGDVCKFKVVQIFDDQIEAEYQEHDAPRGTSEDDEFTEDVSENDPLYE